MSRTCTALLALALALAGCLGPGDAEPWERQDEHEPVPAASCPAHEDRDVSTAVQPRVRFDFPGEAGPDLDPDSLDDRSITLISSGEYRARGRLVYDEHQGVVLFVPRSALKPFVRYELRVTRGVRDRLGNPVAEELVAEFVTGDVGEEDPCERWPAAPGPGEAP